MPIPIIDALPSVHGSLLGIGFSLFGAYAVYAYQKLAETNERLQTILEKAKSFSELRRYEGVESATVLGDDGVLDWVKVENALRQASMLTDSYVRSDTLADVKSLERKEVMSVFEEIIQLMNYFFVSYPFNGHSAVSAGEITKSVNLAKNRPFDVARVRLIALYIHRLQLNWSSYNENYIQLARQYSIFKAAQRREVLERSVIENINKIPDLTAQDRQDRIEASLKPSGGFLDTDEYVRVLAAFFQRVYEFGEQLLPEIQVVIDNHTKYKNSFNFKLVSRVAMVLFAIVFVFGILTPLALSDTSLAARYSWAGYVLGLLSSLPYFIVWFYLWRKISKTDL